METNDPRQSGFNAAVVRDGLRFAMRMGLPGAVSERAVFFWNPQRTFADADATGKPYDWTAVPTSTVSKTDTPSSLDIPVSFEFLSQGSDSITARIGDFDTPRIKLTVLDEEYEKITDENLGLPDGVRINGSDYEIEYWAPPVGLFGLTVYEAFCVSRDEA